MPALETIASAFGVLLASGVALHQTRKVRHLEGALTEARLSALAMQLRPHFLLNALNTAAEVVYGDAERADRLLTAIGRLLAQALRHDGRREVTLREELALLRHYLEIEEARFGDRLVIEWRVDPTTLDARVPPLLLQPLVENAVRHGIAPRHARGLVRIAAAQEGDALCVRVSDDGVGFDTSDDHARDGIGLTNVRARLATLYGARHSLDVGTRDGEGTVVTVRLPWVLPDVGSARARRTIERVTADPTDAAALARSGRVSGDPLDRRTRLCLADRLPNDGSARA